MVKRKDTNNSNVLQAFEVIVEYKDQIIGWNKEDALVNYQDWLSKYTTDWKVKSVKHIGQVWGDPRK